MNVDEKRLLGSEPASAVALTPQRLRHTTEPSEPSQNQVSPHIGSLISISNEDAVPYVFSEVPEACPWSSATNAALVPFCSDRCPTLCLGSQLRDRALMTPAEVTRGENDRGYSRKYIEKTDEEQLRVRRASAQRASAKDRAKNGTWRGAGQQAEELHSDD